MGWDADRDTALVPGRIYTSLSPEEEFAPTDLPMTTDQRFRFEWSVDMAPGETRYWSNTMWRPYSVVTELFPRLADSTRLTPEVFGDSIGGRPLVAYYDPDAATDDARATVLITSGLHPVEADTVDGVTAGRDALSDRAPDDLDLPRLIAGGLDVVGVCVAGADDVTAAVTQGQSKDRTVGTLPEANRVTDCKRRMSSSGFNPFTGRLLQPHAFERGRRVSIVLAAHGIGQKPVGWCKRRPGRQFGRRRG